MAGGILIGIALTLLLGLPSGWVVARALLKRARRAERDANQNQQLAAIGSMTKGLAHEIRNPLSTIGLNAELLGEGIGEAVPDPEERARLLRRIDSLRREADRLREILEDFLSFAGEIHPQFAQRDLNDVVNEMVDFFLPQAQHHGIRFRSELHHGPLPVRIDPNLFKQALLNLLMNATQAMSPAGPPPDGLLVPGKELILRTTREATKHRDAPRPCSVHVIDTGPGIPNDILDSIEHPYMTTKPGGTGLGLPTAKRLIESQEGTLTIHTELGVGSDFTITLPLHDSHAASQQQTNATAQSS